MTSATYAKELLSPAMPTLLQTSHGDLRLNGSGTRKKLMLNVYQLGLYLKQTTQDANAVIERDEPMALRIMITSTLITGEKMAQATRDGFLQATQGQLGNLQPYLDRLLDAFNQTIHEGDIYDLVYSPEQGLEIYRNEQLYQQVHAGPTFKQALFAIWLGNKPIQKSLKQALLNHA